MLEAGVQAEPEALLQALKAAAARESGELKEEELEDVSGGCPFFVFTAVYVTACLIWAVYNAKRIAKARRK